MLCFGIHLGQKCVHRSDWGRALGLVRCEIKQDNWTKEDKDPEELSYASDLNHLSCTVLIEGDACTLTPLGVYCCFTSALDKQTSLCVFSHMYCDSNSNFYTCICSLCLLETFLLSMRIKNQGNSAFSL